MSAVPTTETPVVTEIAAATAPPAEIKPVEPAVGAPATTEPATEIKDEAPKEPTKPAVEPIYHGALSYQISGLSLKNFLPSKRYFWFGEEEAVPVSKLAHYLRGEKPAVAHPTAAWSSVTSKGLLYYVKHADQKEYPAGILNLADATDIAEAGTTEFHFKLHGQKHTFQTKTEAERDGWVLAVRNAAKEAAEKKEEIQGSPAYKEQIEKLSKPAATAVAAVAPAKAESTPKKSTDVKPEDVTRDNASSSSSAASDGEKKSKKKNKSRSVSRGKRASIFNALLGKKEEAEVKKEEKKEEAGEKKEDVPAAGTDAPLDAEAVAARATAEPVDAPAAAETTPAAVSAEAPVAEEEKKEEAPAVPAKPSKRGSIFGNLYEKIRSPTHEKKESEVAPVVPPKDTETPAPVTEATTEAAAPEVAAAPVEAAAPTETPAAEPKAATPHKEKKSFLDKFLHSGEKAKSPTTEAPAATEPPAATEAPATTTEAPAEAAVNGVAPAEGAAAGEPPKKERRSSSFFGSLKKPHMPKSEKAAEAPKTETSEAPPATETPAASAEVAAEGAKEAGKPEGKSEHKSAASKFGGLLRNPSKLIRSNKEGKKEAAASAKSEEKVGESSDVKPAAVEEPAKTETAPVVAEPAAATNGQQSIGDVVPEAVTVGRPQSSTPAVSAAA